MTDEKNKNDLLKPLSDDDLDGVTGGVSSSGQDGNIMVGCACYERNGHNCKNGGTYQASPACVYAFRCVYARRLS